MPFIAILFFACVVDVLLGDPRWFPHPVRGIGWFAARMEHFTRRLPLSERNSGRLTVHLVVLGTGATCAALLLLLAQLPYPVFLAGAACILYTTLAARDLIGHAMQVHAALNVDIETARKAVGMMVGRDTDPLDAAGVIRACIESVAENMSDGIVAPIVWATVGAAVALPFGGVWPVACGATAAMLYKAISTMDSMFGYKNARYLHFGCCPARLDDAANLLPARLSGFAIVLAAPLCGKSMRQAWRILYRDRRQHSSPNSGWPEAAAAGALGIQLGGDAAYGGNIVRKPFIGDMLQHPAPEHIPQACRLIAAASLLCLLTCGAVFFLLAA